MSQPQAAQPPTKKTLPKTVIVLLLAGALLAALYGAAVLVVASPATARKASSLLTRALGQPVTLGHISLHGTTLTVEELAIAGAPAADGNRLLHVSRIRITPDITALLTGRRRLRNLSIQTAEVTLQRNASGTWNMADMLRTLSGRKKGDAKELAIGRLELRDCSVSLQGRGLRNLSLTLTDFSTKGTIAADLNVSAMVGNGGPLRLTGKNIPGSQPGMELELQAPRIPLDFVTAMIPQRSTLLTAQGSFGVQLTARSSNGMLKADMELPLAGTLLLPTAAIPLQGAVSLAGSYDPATKRATVNRCNVSLKDLLQLQGTATVDTSKGGAAFSVDTSLQVPEIARIVALLPAEKRKQLDAGGSLNIPRLQLSGDRSHGLTSGDGQLQLRNGRLSLRGKTVVAGCSGDIVLTHRQDGWSVNGTLVQKKNGDALLRNLQAVLSARLSPRLALRGITLDPFSTDVMEGTVHGSLRLVPGTPAPLSARLAMEHVPLSVVDRFLPPGKLEISRGVATAEVELSGSSPTNLSGALQLRLTDLQGRGGATTFTAGSISTRGRFSRAGTALSLSGSASVDKGMVGSKEAAASFGYALSNGNIELSRVEGRFGTISLKLAHAEGPLPRRSSDGATAILPLRLKISDGQLRAGNAGADISSGTADISYRTASGNRWLEGDASVTLPSLAFKDQKIAQASALLRFNREGADAQVSGSVAGGAMTLTAHGNPFVPEPAASFSVKVTDAAAPQLAAVVAEKLPVTLADGLLSVTATGMADRTTGINGTFTASARKLSLARERKTLVAGTDVDARGKLEGKVLRLDSAAFSTATGIRGELSGQLTDPVSPQRSGSFRLSIPSTPANTLLDTFVNILPPTLQQASAGGSLSVEATAGLQGKALRLDGTSELSAITLELPERNIRVGEVNGRLPLSVILDKERGSVSSELKLPSVNRSGYPGWLAQFRQKVEGSVITVERMQVGAFEVGKTTLTVAAADGRTELRSLHTDLYGGSLTGQGALTSGGKINYGATLIINDLSLRSLCETVPAIRGYLSGKVDGIIDLYRESGQKGGVAGRLDIWSREGGGERMLISREFLQKLAGKNLKGIIFRSDRPFDRGDITVFLEGGYLTFDRLDISHTNLFGIKDLNVSVAPIQNRISFSHLLETLKEAASRSKGLKGAKGTAGATEPAPPPEMELDWLK